MRDLELDTSSFCNEFRVINEASHDHDPNVRFEFIEGRLLVIALRNLREGEELIGDYSEEYQDRENSYLEVFERINDFNNEILGEEERKNTAFEWFVTEGYELLKSRA